jgi:hypothetical protein
MIKPVFSGSIDHRMNLLDFAKVKKISKNDKFEIDSKNNKDLIESYEKAEEQLYSGDMRHGIWSRMDRLQGSVPNAMEGA